MLIKALSVEGFGRFSSPVQVEGFGDGVNVLAAGNEVGKSTLFKAIRTGLFCRHDSRAQEIRDIGSDGSQLPATVQIAFEQNGRAYVIRKAFLRSPSASLTEDGREIARSKQADEAVWDILGVSPGSGRALDDGAFGLLWVGQGASFTTPVLGTGASSMMNAAIESEVGALIGGERARLALDDINVELQRYLTDSEQRPRADGPLHRALAEVERWQAAEAENRGKLAALDSQFQELVQYRRRHRDLTDPAATKQATADLLAAKETLAEAQSAAQELRRLEAEEIAARRGLEVAAQRFKQFRDLTARIDVNRVAEAALAREVLEQGAREQEARVALAGTQLDIVSVEKTLHALSARERQLERLAGAVLRDQRKEELERQLKALETAVGELRETNAQSAQIKVNPKTVESLDELEREIASLDAQLSAAAAQLAVEVKPEGAGQVRIGSVCAEGPYSTAIMTPTTITVADLAIIKITPAVQPRQELRAELEERRLALLGATGVGTVTEAHALLAKRRDLEASRKGTLAQLNTLGATDDPEASIVKLKNALYDSEAAIAAVIAEAEDGRLPTDAEIEKQRVSLAQDRTIAEARRESLGETQRQQRDALESALAARSGAESKLESLRNRIAEDAALCPDDERAARDTALVIQVADAEAAHQTAAATLTGRRQTAPGADEIERRQARFDRLEQAATNRNDELRQLERDVGRLTGQIQAAGGDGVGEASAAATEQRAIAERHCAQLEERVAVLKLLRDTISACLTEGRDRYHEPVRRNLRPFLNDLFPGAELELGDDFAVTGIRRERAEAFDRLSDGTQEQIAVLVRLAMGAMLAEKGSAVPIILDDALVYCDDDRIQRMFDALSRAGKKQQIIVLTCRLRSFGPLGGRTLRLLERAVA
ncbi:AAA family ATPase [Bradyrhizobium sp. ma5]|uniref:AAA family ATPase n=1 Tax=Bradyrhizobium sp. ma5 TaxID=3344828 RepID=UPI0035D3FF53